MKTGNRLLRRKLANNCKSFFEPLQATKFPFAVLQLPKLNSLTVMCTEGVPSYMDLSNGGELALVQGSKTIEKIEFRFRNSLALFLSPNESFLRLSVRDRFPSLTSLILRDIIFIHSLESMFGELSENLRTFSLGFAYQGNPPSISLASVAKLPRYLKTLELSGCNVTYAENDDKIDLQNILPPNLVHLTLKGSQIPRFSITCLLRCKRCTL